MLPMGITMQDNILVDRSRSCCFSLQYMIYQVLAI